MENPPFLDHVRGKPQFFLDFQWFPYFFLCFLAGKLLLNFPCMHVPGRLFGRWPGIPPSIKHQVIMWIGTDRIPRMSKDLLVRFT